MGASIFKRVRFIPGYPSSVSYLRFIPAFHTLASPAFRACVSYPWVVYVEMHGSAPRRKKTSATLHGNAFCIQMIQMGPLKKAPPKCSKPLLFKRF